MRVTSDFWVAAYVRRCHLEGAYAVVSRRGAAEAGAILIVLDTLDGRRTLYGPAPQSERLEMADRAFAVLADVSEPGVLEERLTREKRFDPDFWVVEVEDRGGRHFLELAGD